MSTQNSEAKHEMPNLMMIIASTRPGRVGLPVGRWVESWIREHGGFALEVVDLAELALPFMDEPNHPRLQKYTQPHTKAWSAKVGAADAFVFITPEYNHGMNAPLKNAIDYLVVEWQYKPVGIVSYGGISGGTRAMAMIKQVVTTLKMMPMAEAVNIPFVAQFLNDEEQFVPNEITEKAATVMLDELRRWTLALKPLRQRTPSPA